MTKLQLALAIPLTCLVLHAPPLYGCRYNVREVGFIDVGAEVYRLFVYLPQSTSPDETAGLKESMSASLADSNIKFELVTAGADANRPAMEFLAAHGISRFPAAVLVSPDGQSMPLSLTGGSLGQAVSSAVDYVLHSVTRQSILETAADCYGVVLFLDGPHEDHNTRAREVISTAIGRIREQLDLLPKPIARPPEIVTVDHASLGREQVLLWSLGLTPQDVDEPHAAVFYGRGRWIGPLFKGDRLTADPLTELLFLIGSDCECGLDHRFLQGTMLPVCWDEALQRRVAQRVGFDPEDPMVKMEMVSIVRRGMGGLGRPSMPLGYREIEIRDDADRDAGQAIDEPVASNPQSAIRNPQSPQRRPEFRILAASLSGMAALAAVASVVIVLRARRR
ncbi:MAG: hypothetical protein JW955_10130 [Sedimentisphaerales bacterium]|nr:hypothetical protein [Sedimentisphaerales bacterium]